MKALASLFPTGMKCLLVAAAVSAFAAPARSEATTTLSVQYAFPQLIRTAHEAIAERLTQEQPATKVNFKAPSATYRDQIQLLLRGAVTGDLPDLVYVGLNWRRVLVERGLAVPVDDLIAAEPDWEARGYDKTMAALGEFKGRHYGLPLALSTNLIFYNADLVRRAGGDPDRFPTDWEGILGLAARIARLEPNIEGLHLTRSPDTWDWQMMILSQGGRLMSEDERQVAFDSPEGLFALQAYRRAVDEGGMQNVSTAAARQNFAAGRQGITWNSTAQMVWMRENVGGRFEMRTALMPLPGGPQRGRFPAGGAIGLILTRDPVKQKAAWEYMKLASSAWGSKVAVEKTGYMPANRLAVEDPAYLGAFYDADPESRTTLKQWPYITDWYAFPGENGVKIYQVIVERIDAVVARKETPEAALKKMAADVQALLPE